MPKAATKRRKASGSPSATTAAPATGRPGSRGVGRPARALGHARRQIVVDTALLGEAMRLTGRGQSDTVNAALAQLTENAAILEGVGALFGAFPGYPPHDAERSEADGLRPNGSDPGRPDERYGR